MARLDTMPEPMRSHLADLPCPTFDARPWVSGPPLSRAQAEKLTDGKIKLLPDEKEKPIGVQILGNVTFDYKSLWVEKL